MPNLFESFAINKFGTRYADVKYHQGPSFGLITVPN